MKKIRVIIEESGDVSIEAIGFRGQNCAKATAELEKALGKVKERNFKPEYYAGNTINQQQQSGTGG